MRFTTKQNRVLSEIFRRLNSLHGGDLNTNLLYLAMPSTAKVIKQFGLIEPYGGENPRALSWYRLTEKGKSFFGNYITELDEAENRALFDGMVKTFNHNLLK